MSSILGIEYTNFDKLISKWEKLEWVVKKDIPKKKPGGTKLKVQIKRESFKKYLEELSNLIKKALELKKNSKKRSNEFNTFCEELLNNIKIIREKNSL